MAPAAGRGVGNARRARDRLRRPDHPPGRPTQASGEDLSLGRVVATLGAALIAALSSGQAIAVAHPLTTTVTIPVDEPATIRIQVPAEGRSAMVGVDVEVPEGFRVERPGEPQGWTSSVEAGRVRYRGPQVPIGGTATFDLAGTATGKGELTIPVVTLAADGTTTEWRGGDYPPIVVYAGVSPSGPDAGSGNGGNFGALMAVGVLGAAVVAAGVLALRRRGAA